MIKSSDDRQDKRSISMLSTDLPEKLGKMETGGVMSFSEFVAFFQDQMSTRIQQVLLTEFFRTMEMSNTSTVFAGL